SSPPTGSRTFPPRRARAAQPRTCTNPTSAAARCARCGPPEELDQLHLFAQVQNHRLDTPMAVRLPGETELEKDGVNHLLHRALAEKERRRDRCVVLALCHLAQDVPLAGGQIVERGLLEIGRASCR